MPSVARLLPAALMIVLLTFDSAAIAQDAGQHHHEANGAAVSTWHLMQDGVAFFTFNDQGGPRGGQDFSVQNWWMGMAQRPFAGGTFQANLMLSLEPATLGSDGYREIFQVGETLNGQPLIDRQHPHDFLMQAAAIWRRPLIHGYALTLAAAPVGEPALGPVAFMHRGSAIENPAAPLAHHTLDSTHIAMGVLTAGVDRGPLQVETSWFHGGEPDEQRWDLMDPGALDSWSVRGWYRPSPAWTFQLSHGFLNEPEALEEGDVQRTTASITWLRRGSRHQTATTAAYGRNAKLDADYDAFLVESTHTFGPNAIYGRFEATQVETGVLRFGSHVFRGNTKAFRAHVSDSSGEVATVDALTLGGVRTLGRPWGFDLGAGADVTFYNVPTVLQATHGERPVSLHVFVRVRPPAPMGRMVDMIMSRIGH
jgi:hypothetical protein